jgi:hypothetical protein
MKRRGHGVDDAAWAAWIAGEVAALRHYAAVCPDDPESRADLCRADRLERLVTGRLPPAEGEPADPSPPSPPQPALRGWRVPVRVTACGTVVAGRTCARLIAEGAGVIPPSQVTWVGVPPSRPKAVLARAVVMLLASPQRRAAAKRKEIRLPAVTTCRACGTRIDPPVTAVLDAGGFWRHSGCADAPERAASAPAQADLFPAKPKRPKPKRAAPAAPTPPGDEPEEFPPGCAMGGDPTDCAANPCECDRRNAAEDDPKAAAFVDAYLRGVVPPGTPPMHRAVHAAAFVGTGRRRAAHAEVVLTDGGTARIEVFQWGKGEGLGGKGHCWLRWDGDPLSFEGGAWRRVPDFPCVDPTLQGFPTTRGAA